MYLLDTNICIALNNRNRQALAEFYEKSTSCYIPKIVLAELYKGAYCSQKIEHNIKRINEFTSRIIVLEFDKNASEDIQTEIYWVCC